MNLRVRVSLFSVLLLACMVAAACAIPALPGADEVVPAGEFPAPADQPGQQALPAAPAGFTVSLVAEGLAGPTQMIAAPNGELWVAQLNGAENGGTGQVIALEPTTGAQRVLVEGLLKPTGIAVADGALWIATRRELLRAPLLDGPDGPDGPNGIEVGAPTVVLADLPFNGRSNGTLTVTPRGTLLYETSGSQMGGTVAAGSGRLWELDPAGWQAPAPRTVATGLKGGYAHAVDGAGTLWIGEIGDDRVNGAAPPDELNALPAGTWEGSSPDAAPSDAAPSDAAVPDFGWPACYGYREPAANLGGTVERCATTLPPVALFPPRSTPVSVAVAPWDGDTLLVALWVTNEVRAVARSAADAGGEPVSGEPFLTGINGPQSLLPLDDGSLLVLEFSGGRLYRVAPDASSQSSP
jgi:glucose/arabinose dehydrogenase